MLYMLTERAKNALAKLLKDNQAFVPAKPAESRFSRPDTMVANLHPFKVVGVRGGDEAAFKVWLPAGALSVSGQSVTPTGTAALDDGWYTLTDATPGDGESGASTLYLVVSVANGTRTAKLTTDSSAITGENVVIACAVADLYTEALGDETLPMVTRQLVRSSVCVGTSASTPSGGGATGYVDVVTRLVWDYDETGDHALHAKTVRISFANGLYTGAAAEVDSIVFNTTKHSEE